MRTISAAQEAVLALPGKSRADHIKIEVDSNGSGSYVDLSTYWNRSWIKACTINEVVDEPLMTASVTLFRQFEDINLSPYASASPANQGSTLLYIKRSIKIYFATTAIDSKPAAGDWKLMFNGYIDLIDPASSDNTIKIEARDLGGVLQDAFIQDIAKRPAALSSDISENIIQAIISGSVASPPTLYTPSPSSWSILQYYQGKEPVLDAIKKIADQIGWSLRYRWDNGTSQFRLTYYQPDRAVASAIRTFGPGDYFSLNEAAISVKGIRNKIRVYYYTDPEGQPLSVTVQDAGSISKHGTLYMEVTNKASSQIDSSGEATTMANAILADLKDPTMTHTVSMPLFWPAMLDDYYAFTNNRLVYHDTQTLAVTGIRHTFGDRGAKTELTCRGKPVSRTRSWLFAEGRPGFAPPVDNKADSAATGLATQTNPGTIIVTYDDPASMSPPVLDWKTTRFYVDTSAGFTPGPTNFRGEARTTRFEIGNLTPGVTYYAKIQIVDDSGNVASTAASSAQACAKVGPYHENSDTDYTNIASSGTFAVWSLPHDKATHPPDRWKVQYKTGGSTWGDSPADWTSGKVFWINSAAKGYGSYGVRLIQWQSLYPRAIKTSELIPIRPNSTYRLSMVFYGQLDLGGDMDGNVVVQYIEDDGSTSAGTDTFPFTNGSAGGNVKELVEYIDPPDDTAFILVRIEIDSSVGSDAAYLDVYSFEIERAPACFRAAESGLSVADSTWTRLHLAAVFNYGGVFTDYDAGPPVVDAEWSIPETNVYVFNGFIIVQGVQPGNYVRGIIYVSYNGGAATAIHSSGLVYNDDASSNRDLYIKMDTGPIPLTKGSSDYGGNTVVWIEVFHNDGSNKTVTGFFAGMRV